jgi:transposase
VSPLEEHEDFILGLIKEQPDMTLDEIVASMKKAKIAASRTAVWRFFDRRDITFKKNSVRRRTKAGRLRPRAPTLAATAGHV